MAPAAIAAEAKVSAGLTETFFDAWLAHEHSQRPISREELEAAFNWSTKFGPPNCWTGTLGGAAVIIRGLLRELQRTGAI